MSMLDSGAGVVVDEPPRRVPPWLAILVMVAALAVLGVWLVETPPGVLGKADAIAYAICHRIAVRSFQVDGVPLPLCARCTGIYLGVMTSLFVLIARGRSRVSQLPAPKLMVVLGIFVGIMGVDGVNSYIHLFPGGTGIYEPQNWLRLVTGMYCGIAMFNFMYPVFNGTVWHEPQEARGLNNLRDLAVLCAVAAVVIVLVLIQQPALLWIAGYLSTFGVILMLTMIGVVIFVSIFRLDRSATRWRDLAIPVLAGLTMAFILVGGIDFVRLMLTGTWNGFTIAG